MTPEAITATIADLEARSRDYETRAGECREAAATLRRLYEVSPLGPTMAAAPVIRKPTPPPLVDAAPARTVTLSPARPPADPRPVERRTTADTQAFEVAVLDAMRSAAAPLSSGQLQAQLHGGDIQTLRHLLHGLVERGLVVRTGIKATTRYAIAKPAESAPTQQVESKLDPTYVEHPKPAREPETQAAADPPDHSYRGKLAFHLLNGPLASGDVRHIGEIVGEVYETFGTSPYDEVLGTLEDLVREGAATQIRKGGELHFKKTGVTAATPSSTAASAPAPREWQRVRASVRAELLARVFTAIGDHPVGRLFEAVKHIPGASLGDLNAVLSDLIRDRRIAVRTVGTERRYAKAAA